MALRVYILGDAATYQNYALAVEHAGGIPCFGNLPEDCDCLLLPGGGDLEPWRYGQENIACRELEPERDALELELLARFTALGKPVLGICRGMQTINVFFGGDLVQDWPGHSAIEGVDRLHSVRSAPSFLRELYGERCVVNSRHHQTIDRLGAGLEALQWAEDGVVEAFRHKTLPVWGIQWHPEGLLMDRPNGTADGLALYRAFLSGKPHREIHSAYNELR